MTPVEEAHEYAAQYRRMYEAKPSMSLWQLLKLMWQVVTTRTAPRKYKL